VSKEAKARGDADKFEVSHDRLELGRQIGKGAFGCVFIARAEAIVGIPGYSIVAVKKLKSECFHFMNHTAVLQKTRGEQISSPVCQKFYSPHIATCNVVILPSSYPSHIIQDVTKCPLYYVIYIYIYIYICTRYYLLIELTV